MTIHLNKFGSVFTSRQSGKESYAAFLSTLNGIPADENVLVDFDGVSVFSPSWGDEFLTPLQQKFGERLFLLPSENPSVILTLSTLEKINNVKFKSVETK